MPGVPSWFHPLSSDLALAAPALLTGDPARGPEYAAAAVLAHVPGCAACAVVFPVLRSAGRVDRPFAEITAGPTLRFLLAAEATARGGPVREVIRQPNAGALHLVDALADPRWPRLQRHLSPTTGVRALTVVGLDVASRGALVLAGDRSHSLDEVAPHVETVGRIVELFLRLAWAETRARHADTASRTRDVIGTATGVVMATDGVVAGTALDQLRATAQRSGRRLREVAADVVSQGNRSARETRAGTDEASAVGGAPQEPITAPVAKRP